MKGRTHWDDKWQAEIVPIRAEKRGATRGFPRRSPIQVLLSPKHAYLWSSDGIRCINVGMIAPIMFLRRSPLKSTLSDRYNPIISRSMPVGHPKSLSFPPIVLDRWDLPCHRKRGEISDARFRRPVSYDRMLGSTIARHRWRCEGPNPL